MDNDPYGSSSNWEYQQPEDQQQQEDQEAPSVLITERMRFLISQQNILHFQPQQFQDQPQRFQFQHPSVTSLASTQLGVPSTTSSASSSSAANRHPGIPASDYPMPTPSEVIEYPGPHDVLLGRGGETNNHSGNIKFRNLVLEYRDAYSKASKIEKPVVARELVAHWRGLNPPGRFLAKLGGPNSAFWQDVGDKSAQKRASKSLGEREKPSKKGASSGSLSSQSNSDAAGGQETIKKRPLEKTGAFTKTDEILKRARSKMQEQKKKNSHQPAINPAASSATVGDIYGTSNCNLTEISGADYLSVDANQNNNIIDGNPISGGLLPTAAELADSVFNSSGNSSSSPDSGSAGGCSNRSQLI